MGNTNIDRNDPDVGRCMVKGCVKRAIYRNAMSAAVSRTQRGYCSVHRALAVTANVRRQAEDGADWFARQQ